MWNKEKSLHMMISSEYFVLFGFGFGLFKQVLYLYVTPAGLELTEVHLPLILWKFATMPSLSQVVFISDFYYSYFPNFCLF